jgi:hypothetical protein
MDYKPAKVISLKSHPTSTLITTPVSLGVGVGISRMESGPWNLEK